MTLQTDTFSAGIGDFVALEYGRGAGNGGGQTPFPQGIGGFGPSEGLRVSGIAAEKVSVPWQVVGCGAEKASVPYRVRGG